MAPFLPCTKVNGSPAAAMALKDRMAPARARHRRDGVNIKGTKRNLTNLNGAVDLSMKAKLVAQGALSEGDFSASAVINLDYL